METKKIILILAVGVLLFGGWYLVANRQQKLTVLGEPAMEITAKHYVGDGNHTIEGVVQLPNPCFDFDAQVEVRESFPEQVLIRFTASPVGENCIQVIYDAPFRVTFQASSDALISATYNDLAVDLTLVREEKISEEAGIPFALTTRERRWVEDLQIQFMDISDSRCASDVVCVQAGSVTAELLVNGTELSLTMPGEIEKPNAAVAGSYIITLVAADPIPKSTDALTVDDYVITLRVDIADIKG